MLSNKKLHQKKMVRPAREPALGGQRAMTKTGQSGETSSDRLDTALEATFPASDPVALDGMARPPQTNLRTTRHGLPAKIRSISVELLQQRLSQCLALCAALKHAHWNIRGAAFIALHELLDQLKSEFDDYADLIAERLVTLGGYADGDVRSTAKFPNLPLYPEGQEGLDAHLLAVADAFAECGDGMRDSLQLCEKAGDALTADICTEVGRAADKALWLIEAHLGPECDIRR